MYIGSKRWCWLNVKTAESRRLYSVKGKGKLFSDVLDFIGKVNELCN